MWRFVGELISLIFFFLVVRSVIAGIRSGLRGGTSVPNPAHRPAQPTEPDEIRTSGELRKDPVCGTFVATTTAYTAAEDASTVYFCSKECRDRYQSNRTNKRWGKGTAVRS
jgi:YHS domain-containing protein